MNDSNLIPNTERSPEELREMGRRGGIASGKSRRKKRELQKLAQMLLDEQIAESFKEIVGYTAPIRTGHMVFRNCRRSIGKRFATPSVWQCRAVMPAASLHWCIPWYTADCCPRTIRCSASPCPATAAAARK